MDNNIKEPSQPQEHNLNQELAQEIPQTPEQQVVKPEKEKKATSPLVSILAVILVLVLIGCVAYLSYTLGKDAGKKEVEKPNVSASTITQQTDMTTETQTSITTTTTSPYDGWNTYENDKYGYSFKYPADWELNTDEADYDENAMVQITKGENSLVFSVKLSGVGGAPINDCYDESDITTEQLEVDGKDLYSHQYNSSSTKDTCSTQAEENEYQVIYTDTEYDLFIGDLNQKPASISGKIYSDDMNEVQSINGIYTEIVRSIEWGDIFN